MAEDGDRHEARVGSPRGDLAGADGQTAPVVPHGLGDDDARALEQVVQVRQVVRGESWTGGTRTVATASVDASITTRSASAWQLPWTSSSGRSSSAGGAGAWNPA